MAKRERTRQDEERGEEREKEAGRRERRRERERDWRHGSGSFGGKARPMKDQTHERLDAFKTRFGDAQDWRPRSRPLGGQAHPLARACQDYTCFLPAHHAKESCHTQRVLWT